MTTRVPAEIAARANTGRRLLRDTTHTRVARRVQSPRRRAPTLMGPMTKDALLVEARRRNLLLWLDSLEVLGESPGMASPSTARATACPMMDKADSTPRPSARSTAVRRPAICSTQALATADKAAPRGARARTSCARAEPNKETAAEEDARVGQVASTDRGGDGERSRSGVRGR